MSLLTKSFSFKCSSYSLPMNSLEDFLSVVINSKKKLRRCFDYCTRLGVQMIIKFPCSVTATNHGAIELRPDPDSPEGHEQCPH